MPDIEKDIAIIFIVHPAKKGKRPLSVSAAPKGEMPVLLTGQFADRHMLLDQIFAEVLKRKPQRVKVASAKKVAGKDGESEIPATDPDEEMAAVAAEEPRVIRDDLPMDDATDTPADVNPDQLVRSEPEPAALPPIEGDETPAGATAAEPTTAQSTLF